MPLPWTVQLYRRIPDGVDGHAGQRWRYADTAAPVACFWWTPDTSAPAGSPPDTVTDRVWAVASGLEVGRDDKVVFPDGAYLVAGAAREWDHGPFGFCPGRWLIPLRKVSPT